MAPHKNKDGRIDSFFKPNQPSKVTGTQALVPKRRLPPQQLDSTNVQSKRRRKGKTGSTLKAELEMEVDGVSTMLRKIAELYEAAAAVATPEMLGKITFAKDLLTTYMEAAVTYVSNKDYDIELEEIIGNIEIVYLIRYPDGKAKIGQSRNGSKRVFEEQQQSQETAQRIMTLAQAKAFLREVNKLLEFDIVEAIFALLKKG